MGGKGLGGYIKGGQEGQVRKTGLERKHSTATWVLDIAYRTFAIRVPGAISKNQGHVLFVMRKALML
jgi:hypothetical protein